MEGGKKTIGKETYNLHVAFYNRHYRNGGHNFHIPIWLEDSLFKRAISRTSIINGSDFD